MQALIGGVPSPFDHQAIGLVIALIHRVTQRSTKGRKMNKADLIDMMMHVMKGLCYGFG